MSQTQSIIVYRNPVEQAFWEGATNSPGLVLYIMAMAVISVAVIWLFLGPVQNMIQRKSRIRNKKASTAPTWIASFVVIAIAGYALSFLLN